VDSWITALTGYGRRPNVRHPHRPPGDRGRRGARGNPAANQTGSGRPVRARCDVRRRRERTPDGPRGHDRQEGCLDRPPDPLPTRVDLLPQLPAAYHHALDVALGAFGPIAAEARAAIDDHVRLLLAWNRSINLTAIRDPAAVAIRHVIDSLAAIPLIDSLGVDRLLDLGSGGGFPGIPLAAAMPLRELVLVESVQKKARFLDAAVAVAGSHMLGGDPAGWRVVADRAEAVGHDLAERGRWPLVTARAVAALSELVELAFPLLEPGGSLLAWKAGDPSDDAGLGAEIDAANRAVHAIAGGDVLVDAPIRDLDPEGAFGLAPIADHRLIVVTRGNRPIDSVWPRDPAQRRRRPW
jgi:16S rRNA (guanine527-N7)-methyltransferase